MQAVLSDSRPRRCVLSLVAIGIIVPLCMATLPGVASRILSRVVGPAERTYTEAYAFSLTDASWTVSARDVAPRVLNASAAAIETQLGQLGTSDEALLQEPLLGMRLAEAAIVSRSDPRAERQLSYWAEIFSARLEEIVIPEGTRATLARRLATYQHDVLCSNEVHPGP